MLLLSAPRNVRLIPAQTVLVTGASEGLGLSAAQKLAARGANVILISRSVDKLKEALKSVQVRTSFCGPRQPAS